MRTPRPFYSKTPTVYTCEFCMSAVVTGANATDMKTNPRVLDELVVKRPRPTARKPQHLCEDKG